EETRHKLQIPDPEWRRLQKGDAVELVHSIVANLSYEGTAGSVTLVLKPYQAEDQDAQSIKIEYRITPRRGSESAVIQLQPPNDPQGPPPRIARMVALAHRLEELASTRDITNYRDLAKLGHISHARLSQIVTLAQLAPPIQERILFMAPWE